MLKIGDIVTHNVHKKEFGIVIDVNEYTITVEWLRDNQRYMYHHGFVRSQLIKVSE